MPAPRLAATVLAAASLASLAGCSIFMRSMEKPRVEVRGVALSSVSLTGIDGSVRLDVSNPNPVGVPLSGIDWQLAIGGAAAVSGHVDLAQTIPARGVAPVVASLRIDALAAARVARNVAGGARAYRLDARLHFSTRVGDVTVDVHHDGDLGDAAQALR